MDAESTWAWLQNSPSLEELCSAFPENWQIVQRELAPIFEQRKPEDLKIFMQRSAAHQTRLTRLYQRSRADRRALEDVLNQHIRNRMANIVVRNLCLTAVTGVTEGGIRLNFLNGMAIQCLLFHDDLVRKPVSMFWFRLIWPLIWQRKLLMPLVEPKGIYCFYSREFVDAIAHMIGSRSCLEIAAGDGTLSRFLAARGAKIAATDDHSWRHVIAYPRSVIKLSARDALSSYAPSVVICSWPPANNDFERLIFNTRSVELYVMIGSRYTFASGNWESYKTQSAFAMEECGSLARLILPPELGSAVCVFRRRPSPR